MGSSKKSVVLEQPDVLQESTGLLQKGYFLWRVLVWVLDWIQKQLLSKSVCTDTRNEWEERSSCGLLLHGCSPPWAGACPHPTHMP